MEFADLNAYNGILTDSNYVGTNVLGNIYKTLIMGNVTTSAPYFTKLEDVAQNWVTERVNRNQEQKNTLVLAGIYYKYAQINENALVQNKIIVSNQKYYDKYIDGVWQNPYEVKEVIAFAPPINAYNKYQVKAVLPDNLLLGNSLTDIQQIELNFNDGQGYQVLQLGQELISNYTQDGTYDWIFKTTLSDGRVLWSQTKIQIKVPENLNNTLQRTNFETDVVIQGPNSNLPSWANGAVLRIDYAPAHNGQLKKPFIVAEGFDPGIFTSPEVEGGEISTGDFQNSLLSSGNNLFSMLNSNLQEYDIVYIDWQNGTNSIQHNSEVLKNVLAYVNQRKHSKQTVLSKMFY